MDPANINIYNNPCMIKALSITLCSLLLTAGQVLAQSCGTVVKVDSSTVYIDITKASQPVSGTPFSVFEQGEELVNPQTKQSLGKMMVFVASGSFSYSENAYAVGEVNNVRSQVKPGHVAKWNAASAPAVKTVAAPVDAASKGKAPLWSGALMDFAAVGVALGDVDGDGENELAVASQEVLRVYKLKDGKPELLASEEMPSTVRLMSVECFDLKGAGRAQVYAVTSDTFRKTVETRLYDFTEGRLAYASSLKWLVRGVYVNNGELKPYAQEIYPGGEFRPSNVRELVYRDGAFSAGEKVNLPRLEWVYGFSLYDFDTKRAGAEALYITDAGKLRVQFQKKNAHFDTDGEYARTPNRLRFGDVSFKFYPRVPVITAQGGTLVAAFANVPKIGILSDTFGSYKDSDMEFLFWDGVSLSVRETARAGGVVCDAVYGRFGKLDPGLLVPVLTLDDSTMLKLYEFK